MFQYKDRLFYLNKINTDVKGNLFSYWRCKFYKNGCKATLKTDKESNPFPGKDHTCTEVQSAEALKHYMFKNTIVDLASKEENRLQPTEVWEEARVYAEIKATGSLKIIKAMTDSVKHHYLDVRKR
jgi:hypothetical protein